MRDILFRGKRADNGEWVEGFPFVRRDTNGEVIDCFIIQEAYEQVTNGQRYVKSNLKSECFRVIPKTIRQFTGLTDKSGTKIFEGDILKQKTTAEFAKVNPFEWERYGVVRFGCYDWNDDYAGNTTMGWYIEHLKSVSIQPKNYYVDCIQHGLNQSDILDKYYPMEVIGNIHDNPELLKGGAE